MSTEKEQETERELEKIQRELREIMEQIEKLLALVRGK